MNFDFIGKFGLPLGIAISLFAGSFVAAQQVLPTIGVAQEPVVETFDGRSPELMLGGQIDFQTKTSKWLTYLADGHLIFENRDNPNSLTFNDIKWVKYPDNVSLMSTEGAVISVIVHAENTGHGGGGILIGSGKIGRYLMFSIDKEGRYHILRKDGRELRSVHSAKDSAIRKNAANELSFIYRDAQIVFLVNGRAVIQIPNLNKVRTTSQISDQAGVGLAAFGVGTYRFDTVTVRRGS